MPDFEQYEHHGALVWVNEEMRGRHSEFCLCYSCAIFNPGAPETNCPIANLVYAACIAFDLVLPVWECPQFRSLE